MTTDAIRKDVSAEADDAESNEGVDNDAGKKQDQPTPGEHPTQKRQDIYDRFRRERPDLEEGDPLQEAEETELDEDESQSESEEDSGDSEDLPEQSEDGLGKYIVEKEGVAYFKATVDGEAKLIPLDRAQAQLQKHEAADVRLQQASELRKSLDAKAEKLKASEQESQRRSPSPQDVNADDDEALLQEASGLISSLMEEDDAEAAKKLAAALKKARSSGAPFDREALVSEVAEAAAQQLRGNEQQNAINEGFNAYLREYGDTPVESDPALRAWHAAKVDELAASNPEWSPKQCMLEAGKLACEFAGIKTAPSASDTTAAESDTRSNEPNPRAERKRNLQPMPSSQSAVSNPKGRQAEPQTTRDVIAQMRVSRGQPVAS